MKSDEEPSRALSPIRFTGKDRFGVHWENEEYYGCLRTFPNGWPHGGGAYKLLSISATDETARHDWRDFQQLKNMVVGEEWEAVELYPAESRLIDPSNRFYLWCVPKGVLKFGLPSPVRNVVGAAESIAPQRMFPNELTSPETKN